MSQTERAARFASSHDRAGQPLLLTNVWDPGSALAIVEAGGEAIATSSWAVAAANGLGDGEQLTFASLIAIVSRIVAAVPVPVTVDFERGYAEEAVAAADNLERLLDAGAVGINVEDGLAGDTRCRDARDQARRIEALRDRAERFGIPLFINARTDLFLDQAGTDHGASMCEALERARIYAAAGASGLFVPGLLHLDLIAEVCAFTDLPVNVMVTDFDAPLAPFAACGVRRISRGPAPYIATRNLLSRLAGRWSRPSNPAAATACT